jgi:hypothetical protein
MFKENLLERWKTEKDDIRQQLDDKPGTALRLDWVLPVCSPTASLILVLTT